MLCWHCGPYVAPCKVSLNQSQYDPTISHWEKPWEFLFVRQVQGPFTRVLAVDCPWEFTARTRAHRKGHFRHTYFWFLRSGKPQTGYVLQEVCFSGNLGRQHLHGKISRDDNQFILSGFMLLFLFLKRIINHHVTF